jgi:acetyl-CoA acetyltransferase family protein
MTTEVVITHALRTPFAKAGTALRSVSAVELGRQAVVELVARAEIDPARIDEVVVGCAGNPIDAANVARVVALRANLPRSIPAVTVQRNCGSGLEAIANAAEKIRAGRRQVVVAGGVESMSNYPLLYTEAAKARFERLFRARGMSARLAALAAFRPRHFAPESGLFTGLTDPVCGLNMGETAEILAKEFEIPRDAQDEFALRSHERAVAAEAAGIFDAERIPLYLPPGFDTVVDSDVGPRAEQSMEALGKLPAAFDRRFGTVTAGNSCMVTDGAAMTLVMSAAAAREMDLEPLGRIAGYAWAGLSPRRMGLGPAHAIPGALAEAGTSLEDVDRVEITESFAAQVLACLLCLRSASFARDELGLDAPVGEVPEERLNVHGGAIAIGHPVGVTGTRLVVTLLHELARSGARRGLAAMCVGGGQGGAMVVER